MIVRVIVRRIYFVGYDVPFEDEITDVFVVKVDRFFVFVWHVGQIVYFIVKL